MLRRLAVAVAPGLAAAGFGLALTGNTLDLDNSAVLNNTYGVDLEGADASVYETTIAGNSNTGLILSNYDVSPRPL